MTDPTIHPTRLYSSAEARAILGPTLFDRVKDCAVCKDHYWGRHLIDALDNLRPPAPQQTQSTPTAPTLPAPAPDPPSRKPKDCSDHGTANRRANRRISYDQVKLP